MVYEVDIYKGICMYLRVVCNTFEDDENQNRQFFSTFEQTKIDKNCKFAIWTKN